MVPTLNVPTSNVQGYGRQQMASTTSSETACEAAAVVAASNFGLCLHTRRRCQGTLQVLVSLIKLLLDPSLNCMGSYAHGMSHIGILGQR